MAMWQEIFKNKRAFWIYIPLTILYATSYFQRTALPGTIHTQLTEELSLTATQIGNLAAAFVYPYAVFQLISGALIDRFCGTRVVLTGGLIYLAGIFLFPVCSDIRLLYFARILTGIGASTMFLSVVRETDRLFGRKNYAVMFGIASFCGYGGGLMGSVRHFPLAECAAGGSSTRRNTFSDFCIRQNSSFPSAAGKNTVFSETVLFCHPQSVELAGHSVRQHNILHIFHHPDSFRQKIPGRFCRFFLHRCRRCDIRPDTGLYDHYAHHQFSHPSDRQPPPSAGHRLLRIMRMQQYSDDRCHLLQISGLGICCDLLLFCRSRRNTADFFHADAGTQFQRYNCTVMCFIQHARLSFRRYRFTIDRITARLF